MSIKDFDVWALTGNYLQVVFDRPCLQIADVFNKIVYKFSHVAGKEWVCKNWTKLCCWILNDQHCCTNSQKGRSNAQMQFKS